MTLKSNATNTPKVQITLSMSLDGFITGHDPRLGRPLGDGGDHTLRRGGNPALTGEVPANAGAVVVGRRMQDHVDGWGENPPFHMPRLRRHLPTTAAASKDHELVKTALSGC